MLERQRGVYQPLGKNDPIYDLSDDQVEEQAHSRLPLLVVVVLLLLAGFAGVVWLAYNQGILRGRAGAAVIIIPPEGPLRTLPADAGGTPIPYKGLKIYQQPIAPDQEAQGDRLRAGSRSGQSLIPPASKRAVITKPAVAPAKTETTMLQIGSYDTEDAARGGWAAFAAHHQELGEGLSADIRKADLGSKGIWYRLRIGPFSNAGAAAALCEKLKLQGVTCFVAAP